MSQKAGKGYCYRIKNRKNKGKKNKMVGLNTKHINNNI